MVTGLFLDYPSPDGCWAYRELALLLPTTIERVYGRVTTFLAFFPGEVVFIGVVMNALGVTAVLKF